MSCGYAIRNTKTGQYINQSGHWGSIPKMWRLESYPKKLIVRGNHQYLSFVEQASLYANNYWYTARMNSSPYKDLTVVEIVKLDFCKYTGEDKMSGTQVLEEHQKKRRKNNLIEARKAGKRELRRRKKEEKDDS